LFPEFSKFGEESYFSQCARTSSVLIRQVRVVELLTDCCIMLALGLDSGRLEPVPVGPVISVVASFSQQTENRTFCLVLQS